MYLVRPPYLLKKIYRNLTWNIPAKDNVIYLTFDDGPDPEITPWVLDTLKKYSAKATFFCTGENVQKHPAIFKQIIQDNHAVGNHTFNHLNGWKTNTKEYLENISKCDSLINSNRSSVIGHQSNYQCTPITDYRLPLFRPPYGKLTPQQYSIIKNQYSIIMWDILSGDFDENTTKERCLKNVIANTKKGSVVVFHDSIKARENLYFTLPKALEHFSGKGFRFEGIVR